MRDGIADMLAGAALQDGFLREEARQWDEHAPRYNDRREQDATYMAGVQGAAAALQARPGDCILDAGCGTGLTVRAYARPDVQVVALDLSLESLRSLRASSPGMPLLLVRGDLKVLPFAPGTFSKAICANALQQMPEEALRRAALRELARVVRPEGRVVVSVHNLSRSKKRAGWDKQGPSGSHSGSIQYTYRYEREEFQALLSCALGVERVFGTGLPLPYRFKLGLVSRWLERTLQRWSVSMRWGHMLVGVGRVPASARNILPQKRAPESQGPSLGVQDPAGALA
jgi:SAM-dependent methyltransferase